MNTFFTKLFQRTIFICLAVFFLQMVYGSSIAKVITFNIRLDTDGDKMDQWKYRKASMVDYLISEDADFIGVQEALYHQVAYLDSMLTGYKYIGVGRDDGKKGGEFMALFYKTKTWSIESKNTFWLSETPSQCSKGWDAMCFRVCTWGKFTNKKTGKKIIINNTHLDHKGTIARAKSVDLLISHVKGFKDKCPVLLIGDFNFSPDDSLFATLNRKLLDSKLLAESVLESNPGTFNGFDSGEYGPPYKDRIDYVFFREEKKVLEYKVPIILTGGGGHISDHFPVIVTFELD